MKDKNKTKVHLMKELEDLRRQIIELKESEIRHKAGRGSVANR